ncbi:RTA1 like protein-domain-containing protein, partial [Leptodontidium sp. MPI-SDFR-AT-0119]
DDPANQWKYCPSVPAAFILFVLFACTTLFHIFQAFRYRKAFCWVLIMGGLWETLSFASRIASAHSPSKKGIYDASFLLLIISPLLINAFDYMLLGRMVTFYLPDDKLAGIRGSKMGVIFVCFDIMQIGGGLLSLSKTAKTANLGLHVYTGGVIFQQLLIICFLALTVKFKSLLRRDVSDRGTRQQGVVMIRVLRFSLLLITFRILFRIVEFSFSQGTSVNQYINHHEFFVYVFDAVPMFFALLLMNVVSKNLPQIPTPHLHALFTSPQYHT